MTTRCLGQPSPHPGFGSQIELSGRDSGGLFDLLGIGQALAWKPHRGGRPVFFFHGLPGSRRQRHPDDSIAIELGARIIAIDRPGYGLSDFQQGRTLLDWPDDEAQLADALKIDRFAAMGVSGGGPYLLACAYKMPERITSATTISGMGPVDDPDAIYAPGAWHRPTSAMGLCAPCA